MPRSVNSVAAKARKKKVYKAVKGSMDVEKMFGLLRKMPMKKASNMPIATEKRKKQIFVSSGLPGLMPVSGPMI